MKATPIDIDRARALFEYHDGQLNRKVDRGPARAGSVAGWIDRKGYRLIRIDGVKYLAHRLIYAIVHGVDPGALLVDHIDGDKLNNKIENLRLATNAENGRHRVGHDVRNTSGMRGVYFNKASGKWYGKIKYNGKTIPGPLRTTQARANADAVFLREIYFGEFRGITP